MSEVNQVVIDKAELSKIIVEHFAKRFPEGLVINAEVFFFGSPPKQEGRVSPSTATRQTIADQYLKGRATEQVDSPPVLQEIGAIVVLNPQPKPTST